MFKNIDAPIYSKIALDVASRIATGEIPEGDRINGRSTLAGEYNVSPETIRRAMRLLEDMEVVSVTQGSGVFVKSKQKAHQYIERFRNVEMVGSLRNEIRKLMDQKQLLEIKEMETVDKIIEYSDRLKHTNPFNPIEVEIPSGCHIIGHTIWDTKFWQNTGATIVAIRREGALLLSPGPYALFHEGDSIFVIGDMGVLDRIHKYIYESKE